MKNLHAPWRMAVLEAYEKSKSCILCEIRDLKDPENDLVVHRASHCYVVLNKFPYANGHLMIVPNRHLSHWSELKDEEILQMNAMLNKAMSIIQKEFRAQGFNIGVNLGTVAGAGIPDHVHQHIVPRWQGDVNFMPLLAEVKVISEHLQATCEKLRKLWGGE